MVETQRFDENRRCQNTNRRLMRLHSCLRSRRSQAATITSRSHGRSSAIRPTVDVLRRPSGTRRESNRRKRIDRSRGQHRSIVRFLRCVETVAVGVIANGCIPRLMCVICRKHRACRRRQRRGRPLSTGSCPISSPLRPCVVDRMPVSSPVRPPTGCGQHVACLGK